MTPAARASSRPSNPDLRLIQAAACLLPRGSASSHCENPAPFVIIGHSPGGELTVSVTSARAAAQVVRYLTECCPHTRAAWQVSPHAGPGRVVVFGCARPPIGEHLLNQDAHAFLLPAGEALPPVWVALCGDRIGPAEFEVLDRGMGEPCPDCHQRWTAAHHQHTALPLRSPGEHMHPQLRRPPVEKSSPLPGGGSAASQPRHDTHHASSTL
ncbi:MAG TPA: hypothetical protein VJT72_01320 [Pseudonocardiaceae bacterium]|nr:hypothetical protein [Pseudonocardiaceae bacterium]